MSFSKSPDNRMPQIFSFFYWIFIWSSLKLSPQSPHISRLFLYFYKKKKPKKLLFGQKYYFQQRNFDIFLVSYIYPFVKHRAASSVGSHDIDSCKLISVKKSLNCAHYTLLYTHKHINMQYTLLQKSYIVQEFFKLEERPTITVNEQISLAQDKHRLKFGNPVPGRNCMYELLKKFKETGTLENRKHKGRRRSVRTPEVIDQVEALVAADRDVPIDQPVNTAYRNQLNLSKTTWARILKDDLKLRCYR